MLFTFEILFILANQSGGDCRVFRISGAHHLLLRLPSGTFEATYLFSIGGWKRMSYVIIVMIGVSRYSIEMMAVFLLVQLISFVFRRELQCTPSTNPRAVAASVALSGRNGSVAIPPNAATLTATIRSGECF